ncbi:hypothetical protein KIF59_16035 [Enterobacter cloacae subsp. cloacae]|nr:hypothetical protein [Enterobacter cloacae subsp. cloacae]
MKLNAESARQASQLADGIDHGQPRWLAGEEVVTTMSGISTVEENC